MKKLILGSLLMAAMGVSHAALINPEFDPSLTGWNTVGDASSIDPGSGDRQLMVTTADTGVAENSGSGNSASDNISGLETSLFGVSTGQLSNLVGGGASITDVSAVYNDITVDFSGVLSWDWRMLTDENGNAFISRDEDIGFLGLIAVGATDFAHVVVKNASTETWSGPTSGTIAANYDFENASALQTDNIAGIAGGDYRLVIGVFDENGSAEDSALLVDHLQLDDGKPAPTPGTMALLSLGLLGLLRKR